MDFRSAESRIPRAFFGALCGWALLSLATPRLSSANSDGPEPGYSGVPAAEGVPAEGNCTFCHMGPQLNPDGAGRLMLEGLPPTFKPGAAYALTLRLTHTDPEVIRWGFQLTAVDAESRRGAGTFKVTDPLNTQVLEVGPADRSYVEHSDVGTGIGNEGGNSWVFEWIAPTTSRRVEFYAVGNAANLDGDKTGDRIYSTSPRPLLAIEAEASPTAKE